MDFFKIYGLDPNPASYGITKNMFADMWEKARTVRTGRITVLDDVHPDRAKLDSIYDIMQG